MGRLCKRTALILGALSLILTGCMGSERQETKMTENASDEDMTPEELYRKALEEDVLIVYTVSTRAAQTKDSFEKAYPGLSVEIRDLRSPNLIEEVEKNDRTGGDACDVVLCNDNSGAFKSRLVDTGIVVPYLPADIGVHMGNGDVPETVTFQNEAEMLFYNSEKYETCPIDNLWMLTEPAYRGRIYMPNPLRSFSTFALCGASLDHGEDFLAAYREYAGRELEVPEGRNAAEVFWSMVSRNTVFTNSSDEVVEALNDGQADFGFCVSSKLRFRDIGYSMEPVWQSAPFVGCRISFSVMLARNARSVSCAKLFIRYLLGETDGQGEGYEPFRTVGAWPVRDDVVMSGQVSLSEIDLIVPDQDRLIGQREKIENFWGELVRNSISGGYEES